MAKSAMIFSSALIFVLILSSCMVAGKRQFCHCVEENPLLQYIRPEGHPDLLCSTDDLVIIKDKYPAAKYHFLCLPKVRIKTWRHLEPRHIPLLKNMRKAAHDFITKTVPGCLDNFIFGFHVVPSIHQLHLHMISRDGIKKEEKYTWPSLIEIDRVIDDLQAEASKNEEDCEVDLGSK